MSRRQSLPTIAILVFALIAAFALAGLVGSTSKVDARGEHATDFDGVVLHSGNNYGEELRKVKLLVAIVQSFFSETGTKKGETVIAAFNYCTRDNIGRALDERLIQLRRPLC